MQRVTEIFSKTFYFCNYVIGTRASGIAFIPIINVKNTHNPLFYWLFDNYSCMEYIFFTISQYLSQFSLIFFHHMNLEHKDKEPPVSWIQMDFIIRLMPFKWAFTASLVLNTSFKQYNTFPNGITIGPFT